MKRLMICFLILVILYSCKEANVSITTDDQYQDYVAVKTAPLAQEQSSIPIYAMGRVSSAAQTRLSYKTGGYINKLYADIGDYVRKGKLLGTLRTTEIDAQVLKAKRALEKTQRDLARIQRMYADSVATLENVQDLTTQLEVREADLKIARYNQRYSKILAPHSGRILTKLAEDNELIAPGQPIFVLSKGGSQSYVMHANISDKDVNLISLGSPAQIQFDAYPHHTFAATVSKISESADPMSGTFELEFALHPTEHRLRHGMIGKVSISAATSQTYLKIPTISISEGDNDKIRVYVPEGDKARQITLNVLRIAQDHVWVDLQGQQIDTIITDGSAYLKDGQKIKVIQ